MRTVSKSINLSLYGEDNGKRGTTERYNTGCGILTMDEGTESDGDIIQDF